MTYKNIKEQVLEVIKNINGPIPLREIAIRVYKNYNVNRGKKAYIKRKLIMLETEGKIEREVLSSKIIFYKFKKKGDKI